LNYKDNQRKMINSLLNKEYKKITLDRLVFIDSDNTENFTTDPKLIEKITRSHFQTIGGTDNHPSSFSVPKIIPDEWKQIYEPRPSTPFENPNDLLKVITLDEYLSIVRSLPNGKATGPSTISYEMIKHLSNEMHNSIVILFNKILTHSIVPDTWL